MIATDAAGFAVMMAEWEESQARHAAAESLASEQERELKAAAELAALETGRADAVADLLDRYATLFLGGQTIISLDEVGLGLALKSYATSDSEVVFRVLDRLPPSERDEVSFELTRATTNDDLARFPVELLLRLKTEMTGGWQTEAEDAEIARIDTAALAIAEAPKDAFAAIGDSETGTFEDPVITGETLEERLTQIRAYYDQFSVSRATTDNCHQAAKSALDKMG